MWNLVGPAGTFGIIVVILIISGIKIMKEYQRAVIFRLGRMVAARGPGIIYVIPLIEKLADAAEIIAKHPMALHLRFLQSLVEVSAEKNSTIIFPVPLDLLAPFLKKSET